MARRLRGHEGCRRATSHAVPGVFHHRRRSWIDDAETFPIAIIGSYVARLEAGEDITPTWGGVLAERERVTRGHPDLFSRRTTARATSTRAWGSRACVFHYIDRHASTSTTAI